MLHETANFILWMERSSNHLKLGNAVIALECKESRLDFHNYKDSKLPAHLVFAIFRATFGSEWDRNFEKLHQQRESVWKVDSCNYPNESKEYRLYTMVRNEPSCSSIITITNNEVDTFSVKIEDVAPLLREVIADYPPVFFPRYRNNESTYCLRNNACNKYSSAMVPELIKKRREETQMIKVDKDAFLSNIHQAGDKSGIIETIEELKCLEVLLA